MTALARYRLVDPILIVDYMSANSMWHEIEVLVRQERKSIFKHLYEYLELKPNNYFEDKKKISQSIADEIKSSNLLHRLSSSRLIALSRLLAQFSFFEAATACRLTSLWRLGLSVSTGAFEQNAICAELSGIDAHALKYFAERYDMPEQALEYLTNYAQQGTVSDLLQQLKNNSIMVQDTQLPELSSKARLALMQFSSAQLNLAKKKVLFIGPSVRESEMLFRSDFDLVARIGFHDRTSIAGFEEYETDISLYRDHKLDRLSPEEITSIGRSLSAMIVSSLSSSILEKLEFFGPLFHSPLSGVTLISANLNAGLEAVLVILEADADLVHITHTDLYLNRVYPKGYNSSNNYSQFNVSDGWILKSEDFCRSLSRHHAPSVLFSIYQKLWRSGKIHGDTVFSDIMNDGIISYLKNLEETYHPFLGVQ